MEHTFILSTKPELQMEGIIRLVSIRSICARFNSCYTPT
jgi:hypothetical protein